MVGFPRTTSIGIGGGGRCCRTGRCEIEYKLAVVCCQQYETNGPDNKNFSKQCFHRDRHGLKPVSNTCLSRLSLPNRSSSILRRRSRTQDDYWTSRRGDSQGSSWGQTGNYPMADFSKRPINPFRRRRHGRDFLSRARPQYTRRKTPRRP